jgi:hypothetical protein
MCSRRNDRFSGFNTVAGGGIESMDKNITSVDHDVRKNFSAGIRGEKKCEEIEHALGEVVFFSSLIAAY